MFDFIPVFLQNPIIIIIWFVLLIIWADKLVDWASSIAKSYNISNLVIGLTIVAFWTSAPELVVNIVSALNQSTEIAIWNILWSNISNILLILWVTAMIYPIAMPKSTVKNEIPFVIFVWALLILLLHDNLLSRFDSIILIIFFIVFMIYTFKIAKNKNKNDDDDDIISMSKIKSSIYIILWLTLLIIWGKMIVWSAVWIASSFWLPESFIWLTIVAIWTSLPELASSIMAAIKKKTDMAIWAIVWSNIFNVLWILWISWLITPLKWYWESMNFDLIVNLIISLMIFMAAFTFKKNLLSKTEWTILFITYIAYVSYLSYNVL